MKVNQDLNLTFKEELPEPNAYFELFASTGWNETYQADVTELYTAISHSWYTLCAYDDEDGLIGFGRVVSDGVLYAFICDMIVKPAYQNRGIGSTILRKMIQKCQDEKFRVLWLFAAAGKSGFYRKQGFDERPSNAPGMQLNLNLSDSHQNKTME